MKTLLLASLLSLSAFGQATVPIQVPGEASVSMILSAEAVPAVTAFIKATPVSTAAAVTLNGNVASGDTTINISSSAGLSTGMGILMESEVGLITAINANALTVTRHTIGTSAAAHSSGVAVTFLRSGDYSVFIANVVMDTIKNAMTATPGPAITTANATIATQQAAIQTALASGVTHVP